MGGLVGYTFSGCGEEVGGLETCGQCGHSRVPTLSRGGRPAAWHNTSIRTSNISSYDWSQFNSSSMIIFGLFIFKSKVVFG